MQPRSRTEEHVGEWKVSLHADTLQDLFAEAARVVGRACGPTRGAPGEWERITLAAPDEATLLVDWLNELLGRSEMNERAYGEVRGLRVSGGTLDGDVRGRPVVGWRSPLKAATYHGLSLERGAGRWRATVLFDV